MTIYAAVTLFLRVGGDVPSDPDELTELGRQIRDHVAGHPPQGVTVERVELTSGPGSRPYWTLPPFVAATKRRNERTGR